MQMAKSLSLTVGSLKLDLLIDLQSLGTMLDCMCSFPVIQINWSFLINHLFFPIENVLEHHSDFRYSHQLLYLLKKLDLVVLRHNWML